MRKRHGRAGQARRLESWLIGEWGIVLVVVMLLVAVGAAPVARAGGDVVPPALKDVGVDQRLGERLPLDVPLRDESGRTVKLGDYFGNGRPVLVTLVYFKCPMLCTMTLNQLTTSLRALSENAGEKFDVIALSFNPKETPELAAAKKANYVRDYARPGAEAGWHFLTGSESSIEAVTKAAGFHYRWDEASQTYAHVGVLMVVTPEGKISRYFLGVDYPPIELRQAMATARGEVVGPAVEQVYLYCFHYDPATGKYSLVITHAIKAGGVLIMCGVFGMIGFFVVLERRRRRQGGGWPQGWGADESGRSGEVGEDAHAGRG